ncbi:MAG: DUF4326 domain-containing protein [Candidatus Dormibacteria bacterium]
MKHIPIKAAREAAKKYGYDQIIIIGRKVGCREHVTTYGVDKFNCHVAAKIGDYFKYTVMGGHGLNQIRGKEMSHPLVVHSMREPYDVYIGRPSKWGNPYVLKRGGPSREVILRLYEEYLLRTPSLFDALGELEGKKLGCYCAPKLCHGDILAKWANIGPLFDIME